MLTMILNWLGIAFTYCLAAITIIAVLTLIVLIDIEVRKEKEHGTHS